MLKIQSNELWANGLVSGMPQRWKKRILTNWQGRIAAAGALPAGRGLVTAGIQSANGELLEIVNGLSRVRLSLDAADSEICARAEEFAAAAMDIGRIHHQLETVRAGMASFCQTCGVVPPSEDITHKGAIARMTCRDWWRRGLRKMHAKAVEGAAIKLGYVNRAKDLYVSNESLARRQQQIKRNQTMLENTRMVNELEQEFSLAELAAKGTGNKAIRRGELMTRIVGFEAIARELGHGGLFLTATCPSRMHKFAAVGAKVFENSKYDGTTPREAQQYLSKCWSRARAALARAKVGLYGFRIAEPHHDGCPHWHMMFFHEQGENFAIVQAFRHYFLADSGGEAGAKQHRVKVVEIDWNKGTAAGYIAKYVAKNIDGLHVESDLYGNPAMETSQRVEAWASTWGIRQFQQIGGAPVGVWRELRRVKELPEGAPEHLRAAHAAVNKVAAGEDGEEKKADWAGYCKAQGGVFVGRNAAIRIAKEDTGEIGRYGEQKAAQPVGVVTRWCLSVLVCGLDAWEHRDVVTQSARHIWQRVVKGVNDGVARFASGMSYAVEKCCGAGAGVASALELARGGIDRIGRVCAGESGSGFLGGLARPRTRVNNCTRKGGENEIETGRREPGRSGSGGGTHPGICERGSGWGSDSNYQGFAAAFG